MECDPLADVPSDGSICRLKSTQRGRHQQRERPHQIPVGHRPPAYLLRRRTNHRSRNRSRQRPPRYPTPRIVTSPTEKQRAITLTAFFLLCSLLRSFLYFLASSFALRFHRNIAMFIVRQFHCIIASFIVRQFHHNIATFIVRQFYCRHHLIKLRINIHRHQFRIPLRLCNLPMSKHL